MQSYILYMLKFLHARPDPNPRISKFGIIVAHSNAPEPHNKLEEEHAPQSSSGIVRLPGAMGAFRAHVFSNTEILEPTVVPSGVPPSNAVFHYFSGCLIEISRCMIKEVTLRVQAFRIHAIVFKRVGAN